MTTTETDELKAFIVGNNYPYDGGWSDFVFVAATSKDEATQLALALIEGGDLKMTPDLRNDAGDGFQSLRAKVADKYVEPGKRGRFVLTDEQLRQCGWMATDEDAFPCDGCGLYAYGMAEHAVCDECNRCPTCRDAAMECDGCGEGLETARREAMGRLRQCVGDLVGEKAWAWDYMSEPVSMLIQTLSPSTLRAMAKDIQRAISNRS